MMPISTDGARWSEFPGWLVQPRGPLGRLIVALDRERSRHHPGIATLKRRGPKGPREEPQRCLVGTGEPSAVDRILHTRERRALLNHVLDLLAGLVERE